MNKVVKILLILLTLSFNLKAQQLIKDANFLSFLKLKFPQTIDNNNNLITSEAEKVVGTFNCSNQGIISIDEIQYFINITELIIDSNSIGSLPDISSVNKLTTLKVSHNKLSVLPDLSSLARLIELNVSENNLLNLPDLSSLSQLEILKAGGNQISVFPKISNLTKLTILDLGNNNLTSLNKFDLLVNLRTLELSYNQLTTPPNLSKNLLIRDLYLNNNKLDTLNISWIPPNARNIRVEKNFLTWDDIVPLSTINNYSTKVKVSPQNAINSVKVLNYNRGSKVFELYPFDQSISQITYSWLKNGVTFSSDSMLSILRVQYSDSGSYKPELRHPSFPTLVITGYTIKLVIKECIDTTGITYKITPITCSQTGTIKIESKPSNANKYCLYSPLLPDSLVSLSGEFLHLKFPSYTLKIFDQNNCYITITSTILIKTDVCQEIIITPNGDGDKDNYYFFQKGTLKIFNNQGLLIDTIQCPTTWTPQYQNQTLPIGYYHAYLNDGEEKMGITVIY